jgi:predicted dehydrogenase
LPHFEYTKQVLQAGKHAIVEKHLLPQYPRQRVSRHRKSKGKAGCFSKSQVDSDFKTVKQVLCEGALGEIVEAEFHFDRYNQH